MPNLLVRLRLALTGGRRSERRQARALARNLGMSEDEATQLLRRSREVGFGAAMLEASEEREEPAGS
jgi:hypothetical protein